MLLPECFRKFVLAIFFLVICAMCFVYIIKSKLVVEGHGVKASVQSMNNVLFRSDNKRKKVLIFSNIRSGSSFLGEMFERNTDSFWYYYEPLKLVRPSVLVQGTEVFIDKPEEYWKLLMNCKLREFMEYSQLYNIPTSVSYWHRRVLCGQYLQCKTLNLTQIERTCLERPHVAIKDVAAASLGSAAALLGADDSVYVIYLIRDPRGIYFSRLRIRHVDSTDLVGFCKRMKDQVEFASAHLLDHPRFLAVRYEDLAGYPEARLNNIYAFLGFSSPPRRIVLWLRFLSGIKQDADYNTWTLNKNPGRTWQKWRTKISWDHVSQIQNNTDCLYVMQSVGYKYFINQNETRTLENSPVTSTKFAR